LRIGHWSIVLVLVGVALGAAQSATVLREQNWLSPGPDLLVSLTTMPMECLAPGKMSAKIEIGRVAFRDPLLLGGQAARAGLSCNSCHQNGRGNPNFYFPGLSGRPGTADVTSSLLSSHRGDGVFNPVAIPDLGGPASGLSRIRTESHDQVRSFIHGLITEEFDGAPPPASVEDGLVRYVMSLSPGFCDPQKRLRSSFGNELDTSQRAVRAAIERLEANDRPAALAMVRAARSSLGRIAERYSTPGTRSDLLALKAADATLQQSADQIRTGSASSRTGLVDWLRTSDTLAVVLERHEHLSLFESARLNARLP
jgi:hypothetical protein